MKNWKSPNRLPVYILVAGVLSACGTSMGTFSTPTTSTANSSLASGATNSSSSGSSGTTTTTPDPTTTGTGSAPAYQFAQFGVTGSGGLTPTYSTKSNGGYISTDNVLKVRVTAANGGLLQAPSGYSGFSTNYSCVSFNVYIYDDSGTQIGSKTTQMLQVSGQPPCLGSTGTDHQDLDFSGSVSNPHGGIEVRVTANQYDFYCKLWYQEYNLMGAFSPYYQYYSYWCPSKAVYMNHTVDASLQVQVNGTTFQ